MSRLKRKPKYILRLYVSGVTPRSSRAILNLKTFCEKHLAEDYVLDVVDIYQQPAAAKEHDIIAAPTLIKQLPTPLRRFIGDLSSTERLLLALNLLEQGESSEHDPSHNPKSRRGL